MRDGSFLEVKAGQHLTSVRSIAENVGWYERGVFKAPNPKTISSILEWLVKQNMIKIDRGKGNRQYTLITLLNWDSYQSNEDESNSKYTVSKQSLDINKNDKNEKKLSSSSIVDSDLEEVMQFYQSNLQASIIDSPHNQSALLELYDDWGKDLLLAAMKLAAEQEKKGIAFLKGILNNWQVAGVKSLDDARRHEKEFRNRRSSKVTPINRRKTVGEIDWDSL